MKQLNHWHPVIRSRDLKKDPVSVTLCGQDIVLFRTNEGTVGALEDQCCHRGMRLSKGRIDQQGCLVCPYHGWRYAADGTLETSSVPKTTHQTRIFATCERFGLVWLKSSDSNATFPELDFGEFEYIGTLDHVCQAPLEVTLDNFTEVEHTGTAHAYFGYTEEGTADIETEIALTDATTAVVNKGVQRPFPWFVRPFLNVRPGDLFYNTWVTHFSPVYTVYDQFWTSPDGKQERFNRLKIAIFFNPIDSQSTQLFTLIYGRPFLGRTLFRGIVRHIIAAITDMELRLDKKVVDNLADKSPSLRGKKLGRFDQVLIQNRKRIQQIYRKLRTNGATDPASVWEASPTGQQPSSPSAS